MPCSTHLLYVVLLTRRQSARRSKRVKTNSGRAIQVSRRLSSPPSDTAHVFLDPILNIPLPEEDDFENTLQKEDYIAARARYLQDGSEPDAYVCSSIVFSYSLV
jgi:hypothetical protein